MSIEDLGLILEEQGDRTRAIQAFVSSLKAHPNQTVREHLMDLDREAAAAADPLAPTAMQGPFLSIAQFCTEFEKPRCAGPHAARPPQFSCSTKPEAVAAKVAAPYVAVHVYSTVCDDGDAIPSRSYHVAVRTQAGWWFAPERFQAQENPRHYQEQRTFPELSIKDLVPGTPPKVLVRSVSAGRWSNAGHYSESEWEEEAWVLVGLGPSGKPSATPAFPRRKKLKEYSRTVDEERPRESTGTLNLTFTFQPGSQLEIAGEIAGDALDMPNKGALLGRHLLLFP